MRGTKGARKGRQPGLIIVRILLEQKGALNSARCKDEQALSELVH